jgi:Leucine-rich repeat (LRR) protein
MSVSGFEIDVGRWGKRLVQLGPWSAEALSAARSQQVKEITFRSYICFPDDSIEFICELQHIVALSITHGSLEVKPIECLHNLRALDLGNASETPLDFRKFPHLEECFVEWSPAISRVFDAKELTRLSINRPPKSFIPKIATLPGLRELSLLNCPAESLEALRNLRSLRTLRLTGFKKLKEIAFLSALTELERLWIQNCTGFASLEPLRSLGNLTEVTLDNCGPFQSLEPLKDLHRIERFVIMGPRKRVDAGDYSFVENLPRLQHYFR